MKKEASFTLVEILVVITIIGLLASIVFVSVGRARQKGRIAAGLQMESSINHTVGVDNAGAWNFDSGLGTQAIDDSGHHADGILQNGPVWKCASDDPNNTPSGRGCSVEFDGINDFIEIPNTPQLNPTKGITITLWLNPSQDLNCSGGNNWRNILNKGFLAMTPSGFDVVMEEERWLVFDVGTVQGRARFRTFGVYAPLNEWTFFAASYNASSSSASLFLNGQWIDNGIWESQSDPDWGGEIVSNDSPLNINHDSSGCVTDGGNFPGKIDNVRIFGRSLSQAQIQRMYVLQKSKLITEVEK